MIYLLLTQSYRNYNKLRIANISYIKNKVVFSYDIYKGVNDVLFSKNITIADQSKIDLIGQAHYANLSSFDAIQRALIEYLISQNVETGTIEIE